MSQTSLPSDCKGSDSMEHLANPPSPKLQSQDTIVPYLVQELSALKNAANPGNRGWGTFASKDAIGSSVESRTVNNVVLVFVSSLLSVTVKVTVYLPGIANVWYTYTPNPSVPSPKSQW